MYRPLKLGGGLIILLSYILGTIAIGWFSRRGIRDAKAYVNASRSLPLLVVTAAYLPAGALEIMGLSAMAAQYGVQTLQLLLDWRDSRTDFPDTLDHPCTSPKRN